MRRINSSTNEWTNVVFTFDKETKTGLIYKNGVAQQVDMEGSPESITPTTNTKKIGVSGYGDGAQLHAGLDDFRIYSGAMSASQVKALYEDKDIQSVSQVLVTTPAAAAPVLPETVPVQYENGTEGTAAVSWDAVSPEAYMQPGEFNVNGRVEGTAFLAKAVVTVTKTQDKIVKELGEANVSTMVKQAPVLPTVVQATYEDGTLGTVNVVWQDIDSARYEAAGMFTVTGDASGTDLPAVAKVTVLDTTVHVIVSLREVEVTTKAGNEPVLPTVITAIYGNGSTVEVKVVWADIEPNQYAVPGSFTVSGVVKGTELAAKATVTVTRGNSPTPTPAPTPTPTPTPTPASGIKAIGEDAFAQGQDSFVKVALEGNQTSVSLPVNAGTLLGARALTIGDGKASLTIPAFVLAELGAMLPVSESKGASILVRLTPASPAAQYESGRGSYKPEGKAYEFGLVLRKADGTEVALSAFPQAIKAVLPYSATAQNDRLLGVYLYNEKTSQWTYVGGIIDPVRKEAVIELGHFSTYAVLSYDKSFADVSSDHWVYGALKSLAAKHVATGMTDSLFVPNSTTTRAEFTAMLVRALNLQEGGKETPFSDVKAGSWYAPSVAAAYQAGLIQGVSETTFVPDAIITREQMAVLLIKAYEYKLGQTASAGGLQSVSDGLRVSDWAETAVDQALAIGIMQGTNGGQFDPQGSASRAQTVQAIYNFLQALQVKHDK